MCGVGNRRRHFIAVAEAYTYLRIFLHAYLPSRFVFQFFQNKWCSQLIVQAAGTESAELIVGHSLEVDVSTPSSPRNPAGLRAALNVLLCRNQDDNSAKQEMQL